MTDTPATGALIAKACPFCVSEFPPVLSRDKAGHIVICVGCSALGPTRRMPDEAMTAWNTRAGASGEREAGPPCVNCGKAVEIGQVIVYYDDAGEIHADCESPFSIQVPHLDNEPPLLVLLGSPMRHVPLAALTRSEADEAPGVEIPAGMVRWNGGDSAPADWDDTEILLLADGSMWRFSPETDGDVWWGHDVSETGCLEPGCILAYTPIAQPVAPSREAVCSDSPPIGGPTDKADASMQVCQLVVDFWHDHEAWGDFASLTSAAGKFAPIADAACAALATSTAPSDQGAAS